MGIKSKTGRWVDCHNNPVPVKQVIQFYLSPGQVCFLPTYPVPLGRAFAAPSGFRGVSTPTVPITGVRHVSRLRATSDLQGGEGGALSPGGHVVLPTQVPDWVLPYAPEGGSDVPSRNPVAYRLVFLGSPSCVLG